MRSNRARALWLAPVVLAVSLVPVTLRAQATAPAAASRAGVPAANVPEFGTMWTFDAPPLDYWKARYDFAPDQAWLDHVRLSAVRLPGCSASFVSADGLVMTNHHCARRCITSVSPADTNYMSTGYVAATGAEEKKCDGMYADQLESIQDVTARIRAKVTATDAAGQVAQRDAEIQAIQSECGQSTGLNCQVVSFYQGGKYSLYRYHRYDDLRLVLAPEEAISFFGGDPDNFTYPRYDLDVTLLRVYENGQPLHPRDYLHWSKAGAQEGDLVFVVGNPGSTGRLLTMAQMKFLRDVDYPARLAGYRRELALLESLSAQSEANRRRFENTIFSLANSQKAVTGYLAGLTDSTIMARKQAFEKDFRSRIDADPGLRARYGGAWDAIAAAEREMTAIAARQRYYALNGSTLLEIAAAMVRLPAQQALPEAQRLPAYRGAALARLSRQLESALPIDTALDRLELAGWLEAATRELPAGDPVLAGLLAGRTPERAAAALLSDTRLGDAQFRKALLAGGAQAVAASTDPLVALVRQLEPLTMPVTRRALQLDATISANAEQVGRAIFAAYGTALPPDATFTLRISDGVVKGYHYNGTIAPYKTSFYGLYARSADFDDQPPFQLPTRWARHVSALDLSTPLDFVTTNDIIGGNSGSPVLDRNGEVVGLIFDGNIEQLPNRFIFTDEVARSVAVHSRAIPEAIRKVFEAPRIADELQGTTQP